MKKLAIAFLVASAGMPFASGSVHAQQSGAARQAQTAAPQKADSPPSLQGVQIVNPQIDIREFLATSNEAAKHRESRRVSEAEFIRMAAEPGVIVLDARSKAMYDLLHIKGAINLSFPDISLESVARVMPDKNARILIYCNNNFKNETQAFAFKNPGLSLNVPTYVTLYGYGYRNVYELAPLIDLNQPTKLQFAGTSPRVRGIVAPATTAGIDGSPKPRRAPDTIRVPRTR